MVKSRFSSLDVRAMVNSTRPSAVGCKLTNIYDINSRVYILKLARTGFKCFLLLESGVRFHLTEYERDKSSIPSNYTMKLRKHLRTRRLTAIEQLGVDRAIDLTFGRGENAFHLILELYVSGNLLLTDHEYRILALLRTHSDKEKETKVALRQIYPVASATGLLAVPITEFAGAVEEVLNLAGQRQENQELKEIEADDDKARAAGKSATQTAFQKRSKKRVNHSAMPLVAMLHRLAPFADPALCASCISKAMQAADLPCENAFKLTVDDLAFDDVVVVLQQAAEFVLATLRSVSRPSDLGGGSMPVLEERPDIEEQEGAEDDEEEEGDDKKAAAAAAAPAAPTPAGTGGAPEDGEVRVPGWIIRKRIHVPPTEPYWANDEYTPLPPEKVADPEAILAFPTFHRCVDEFYTKLEEHRAAEQKAQHAKTVFDKVERIRQDQGRRVGQLEAEQEASERKAALIEANVELVERALFMINTLVASQIPWDALWKEVKRQQRLGHPIAQHIHSLDLERSEFQFLLSGGQDEDGEGEEDRPMEVVTLDLNLSSHANIARLHARRKETREKTSRTMTHAEAAIKQAERKAQQDLQKFQLKQTIRRVRQNWWFEKFFWFVSSENYLVIAGHDAMQAEQIFIKHIGPKDVFVQADVAGARTCFIRNPSGGVVPPATLREAGTMTLCHSAAWDKNLKISAWWVPVEQVSKGIPPENEDYQVVDGFFVVGRRQYLPPANLEMGLTLLFHVGAGSLARHKGERRSRYLEVMGATPGPEEDLKVEEAGSSDNETLPSEGEEAAGGEGSGRGEDGEGEGAEIEREGGEEEAGEEANRQEQEEEEEDEKEEAEEAEGDEQQEDREANEVGTDQDPCAESGEPRSTGQGEAGYQEAEGGQEEEASCRVEAGADAASAADAAGRAQRGRISRAERRKMKTGGTEQAGEATEGSATDRPPAAPPAQPKRAAAAAPAGGPTKAEAKPAAASGAPLPRGQRAKARKMKEKYAEQDEEERELKLALLGSKATKRLAPVASGQEGEKERAPDPAEPPATPQQAQARANATPARQTPGQGGKQQKGQGQGKGAQPPDKEKRPPPPPKREQPERRLTAGCEAEAPGGPADEQLARLDLLTGQPHAEDEVLYALPMVAPYCALGGPYAHRAKLTPGPSKKGQVVKQVLKLFEAQVERQAWRLLVQAIPENEATSLMMGSCKVSMPGMQKLQLQLKKDKKKEMKEKEATAK